MTTGHSILIALVATVALQSAFAQVVERPRPAGWERLVPGGRFMDRFEAASVIGNGWTTNCWGGENVKPRDIRNGIEDPAYSYWGGNITKIGREYHLFVARWKENEPRGHMFWPHSEIAHAVSNKPNGDFKVVEVLGPGHNPELFRCKDGSWAVYCVNDRKPCQAMLYRAKEIGGPWTYERMQLDLDGKTMIEGESNFSFCTRPDGSVLAVCRGGGIWLSEDGLKPFVRKSEGRVYPDVEGRFEDPVLWRDEVQYHIIVNDWLGRVAWKLVSPDGFTWTTLPGEAYTPGIARTRLQSQSHGGNANSQFSTPNSQLVTNDWFKYERMRVFQDGYGRVVQANFAVIDCAKKYDRGSDIHSSKNITIPVNPGRRIETFKKTRRGWEARIAKERGFDPLKDVEVDSLILGSQSMVAFGAGVKPIGTDEANGDLVIVFPSVELDSQVVEILGREKNGRLFFATARTDGTKLGFSMQIAAATSTPLARMAEARAKFIGAGPENGVKPCCVKKAVVNEKMVAKAIWRVTGLGVFVPLVNGTDAAPEEVLLPGYTHFTKRRHEIALDVTTFWNKTAGATNELSPLCTSGWWCDKIAGKNGGTWPAFRGVLELAYAEGGVEEFVTDGSWLATTETALADCGIWEGASYDSRIEPTQWREAVVSDEFKGEVSPRIGPPIVMRNDLRMEGEDFSLVSGETKVIDFGQNAAAIPLLRIRGKPGTKVTVRLGEMLNDGVKGHHGDGPEGSVYLANMRGAKAGFDYICNEAGAWGYMPAETFFGYRYAAITADGKVEGYIASIPVSSVSKGMEHGTVETGREDVNRLVKNAYWGMLSNCLSIPTDCPQRTERYGWTGDTQVFAKTGAYFADIAGFMRKWMRDVRDTQAKDGSVPLVCPIGSWEAKGPIAGWSDAAVIVPWTMWKYLGDEKIVRENWPSMESFVNCIAKNGYTSKRGTWLLCDWLSFEKLTVDNRTRWSNGGYTDDHLSYQNFLNACHLLQDCRMMVEMAKKVYGLSSKEGVAALESIEKKTCDRILETWFKPDGTLCVLFDGMQTPALFALKLGLGARGRIAKALVDSIHANGDCLATGFLGTPLLCEVLSDIGETKLAYTLLLQHGFPSWLYSVDQGATTIWERWNGYTKEKGFGPVGMNSFNHYSYGAVVGWLFEHAAGIRPDGANRYVIRPEPDERLGSIKATFRGLVSAWDFKDGKPSYSFTVPQGVSAHVILADGRELDVGEGVYTL